MSVKQIHADGIAWPLQTYLDAYAYLRVDPYDPPRVEGQLRVTAVTESGELRGPIYADQLIWRDVIAFRPADTDTRCRVCSDRIFRVSNDICDRCDADYWHGDN